MRHALLTIGIGALLVSSAAGCDSFYVARATVPLAAPADTSCLHSELGAGTRYSPLRSEGIADGRTRVVAYSTPPMFHNEWRVMTQVAWHDSSLYQGIVYRDSGATLGSSFVQVNRLITRAQAEGTGALMTEFLLDLGRRCGGHLPNDEPLFALDVNETPYRGWVVRGTHGRIAMRLTVDDRRYRLQFPANAGRYTLRVDTLADQSAPRVPQWLPADTLALPTPGKKTAVATDCSRGDSASSGDLVALVRESETQYYPTVLDAWALNRSTRRLSSVPVDGVECRSGDWGVLPDAPRALRRAALTFRPSAGMARVYAFLSWPDFPMEDAIARVAVDSQVVGWVDGGTFVMVELPPGTHRISAFTGSHEKALALDASADSSYFVELRTDKLALSTKWRARIQRMDPVAARSRIRAAHMASSSWPGSPVRARD